MFHISKWKNVFVHCGNTRYTLLILGTNKSLGFDCCPFGWIRSDLIIIAFLLFLILWSEPFPSFSESIYMILRIWILFIQSCHLFIFLGNNFIFKFIQLFLTWTETIDDTSCIVFIINIVLTEGIKYFLI